MTANLYAHVRAALLRRPDSIAIESPDVVLINAQLDKEVARYANALIALGVRPGDRVAAQVEKSIANIALYFATLRIGATYLPLNTAYQPAEIEYFLRDATPSLFVTTPERSTRFDSMVRTASLTANDGSLYTLATQQADTADVVARNSDDLAVVCYTSGTTGRSKGAMITHGNLLSNAQALIELWEFTANDVLLHALPLYHIHGLFVALHCAALSGAKILFHERFEARTVLRDLPSATVMMGVPTFYTRLLDAGIDRDAARHIRVFISGSAPLLTETFNSFEARTGHRILERYGMTETGIIASNPLNGERRAGTVGLPLPHVNVRIAAVRVGDANRGVGVVEVKGPNVFKGYWNMPDKTAQEFRDDYFITGDLGCIESDGYLRLVGRAKDLIISGGLNVYPKEIEAAIDALDGVVESAVFALPHPDFGEAVAAAVTLQPDAEHTPDTIIAMLRDQLAAFKLPKRIYIVDELPRNAMGKVQKNLLRERYRTELTAH